MFGKLVSIELYKIFRKWRTYIGFIAIGVLLPIIHTALYYEGSNYINFSMRALKGSFLVVGNLLNAYLVGYLILQALIIHIPFLIVLVGGDLMAGEATAGTYRMLVTRPVSRFKILTAKFTAGIIYIGSLLLFLALMSIGLGSIIFGTGELLVYSNKIYIFAASDVIWRFLLAYLFAMLSMSTVFSLSFLFSSVVENAIGPIVATMALIIIFIILSALPIEALSFIKPYLFTNHMNGWTSFFADPVEWSEVLESALVLGIHTVSLYLISLYLFIKKDILS